MMRSYRLLAGCLATVMLVAGLANCGDGSAPGTRPFQPVSGDRWIGNAICYGPHRDGQRPGGPGPTADQIREDLHLMIPHWNLLRLYGSTGVAGTILETITVENLDLKVMLGVWIAVEDSADAVAANRAEVDAAIGLANAYPEIVIAVSVGNETQVEWSAHRSSVDVLIDHLRRVRAGVTVPVTSADDYAYWKRPESRTLADELDFLTVHAHPLWNGKQLAESLPWLQQQLTAVGASHPDHTLVLGETGWATEVHDQGEQAELIKGAAGEAEQQIFHDQVRAWAEAQRQAVFFFEAFDENWKGGPHPAEVEKHWGLFRADRSAKQAMAATITAP